MKKLLLPIATVLMLGVGSVGVANAGIWSWAATQDWKTLKSVHYKVSAYGQDFRVYQWQSPLDPAMVCSALSTDNHGMTNISCIVDKNVVGEGN